MDDEAAVARGDGGEVDLRCKAAGVAEHHVAGARMVAAVVGTVCALRPDNQVGEAVAVDVAGRGHRLAGYIVRTFAMDDEAAVARGDGGEIDLRSKAAGVAEHHVSVACLVTCVAGAVGDQSPDENVIEAVAVDVAGRRDRIAGPIARILAMDDEATVAARHRGEVDLCREAGGLAEHHITVARPSACVARPVAARSPDDEIVEAVAVDVPGRGHRPSRPIVRILAMDDEAAGPGGYIHQIDRHALLLRFAHLIRGSPRTLAAHRGWCIEVAAGLREQAGTRVKAARDRLVASFSNENGWNCIQLVGRGVHFAECLAAGRSKGLEPRCRPLEFVWRFSGFPDYGMGLLLKPYAATDTDTPVGAFRT